MKQCSIYFLIHNKKIVYIGSSINVTTRLKWHKDKRFTAVRVMYCKDKATMLANEIRWIKKFKPKYNINHRIERTVVKRVPVSAIPEIKKLIADFRAKERAAFNKLKKKFQPVDLVLLLPAAVGLLISML